METSNAQWMLIQSSYDFSCMFHLRINFVSEVSPKIPNNRKRHKLCKINEHR